MWYLIAAIVTAICGGIAVGIHNKPGTPTSKILIMLSFFVSIEFVKMWRIEITLIDLACYLLFFYAGFFVSKKPTPFPKRRG